MLIEESKRVMGVSEYYFSRNGKRLDGLRKMGVEVINLGVGSPDMSPSASVIDVLCAEAKKKEVHGYQPYVGIPALRQGYADWYKKWYGVSLNPENEILPLIGSKEGVMHIMLAFINAGDGVLVPDPGYPTYGAVAQLVGARVAKYRLWESLGWQPNFDKLEWGEYGDLDDIKLMWVNYPNMPTGAGATMELFERLVEFGLRHKIMIVNDNPYGFILHGKPMSILEVPGAMECCIELNSMSKAHNMAGWRFGVAISNGEVIDAVLKVKSNMDSGVFGPMQSAAVEALTLDKDWFDQLNIVYRERQQYAFEIMESLGCTFDKNQGGLFVWARIPDRYRDAEELSDAVLEKTGIFITPGFIFGEQGVRYLRLSLCAKVEVLQEALRRINEFFK